ncbi:unnamed protein product [Cochlearia groenlandica]
MERNSFRYLAEKRSGGVDPGSGFGSSKRAKTHHAQLLSPLIVPVGHASFRLLCPISQVGSVIGKSGSVIKQLQQSTGAKIRVEEPPIGSQDRVITIIAQVDSTFKLKLGVSSNCNEEAENEKEEEEIEVSNVQAALIRVFEVLAEENDGGSVICRLLTESSHAGAVIGKGGQIIGSIRKETGCKIAIRTENLPICADAGDQMVEIEGNVIAAKKALLSVSRCLQDCQPVNKIRVVGNRSLENEIQANRPIETIIQESLPRSFEDYDYRLRTTEMFPRDTRSHNITASASMTNASTMKPPLSELERGNQEVVFKILCSNENAGGVIGNGGKVIRALHSETGAFINVGNTLADCEERLIAVTAAENAECQSSPAQKAIILVFSRLYELATKKILGNGPRTSITARLVVPTSQIGCLLGKGGVIVSEMRKTTGAGIQILKVEQNPKCVSEDDQVVQISGEFPNVREAIFHVTSRMRDSLFSNSMKNSVTMSNSGLATERIYHGQSDNPPSFGSHQSFSHPLTISTSLHRRSDDSFLNGSHSSNYLRPAGTDPYIRPEEPTLDRFNPPAGYSPNFGRRSTLDRNDIPHHFTDNGSRIGHKSAIVTNTTVEIKVPESAMSFVYGEHGYNLEQLRQISGARVIVHEPPIGSGDRIIVISGTPDQTQAAQNLLHAFILTGETSMSKKHNLN